MQVQIAPEGQYSSCFRQRAASYNNNKYHATRDNSLRLVLRPHYLENENKSERIGRVTQYVTSFIWYQQVFTSHNVRLTSHLP